MCTISVIELNGGGLRLVTNRDVGRSRSPASQPSWHDLPGGGQAVWPTDPEGGGTWVGAADHGLTLTLLNGTLDRQPDMRGLHLQSRGSIIPALIGEAGADDVMSRLASMRLADKAPFRLVACQAIPGGGSRILEAFWDRTSLRVSEDPSPPLCFASSGLGDSKVQCRLPLFAEMVGRNPTPQAQDAFHRHYWDEYPELSVWMTRADARSVSRTAVELTPGPDGRFIIQITYEPLGENPAWLERRRGAQTA